MVPPPPDLNHLIDALEGEIRAIQQRTQHLQASPLPTTQLQTALMDGEISDLEHHLEEVAELDRQRRLWTARTPKQDAAITRFNSVLDAPCDTHNAALRTAHDRQQHARANTGYQGMNEAWRDPSNDALNHPVAHLPLFAELINGHLEDAQAMRASLEQELSKPHALDDATLDRMLASYRDSAEENVSMQNWQLRQWKAQSLTDEQHLEVTRLQGVLEAYQREAGTILELEQRLRRGSIDRILEKSDAELGLDALLRMIGKKPR
jgi:hypothetical protein